MSNKLVLLTGGSGFIGRYVLAALLDSGASVRAVVRSTSKGDDLKAGYPSYGDKLETTVVENMEKPGAFDDAVRGVDVVVHLASPLPKPGVDNEVNILIPAREGIVNMLKSATKSDTVKRVVMVSSSTAVLDASVPKDTPRVWTERDWNPLTWEDGVKGNVRVAYAVSKTHAEKAAWEFMEKASPHFDLIVLNPPGVFGPLLERPSSLSEVGGSDMYLLALFDPNLKEIPKTWSPFYIDVRDVAIAHVKAAFAPASAGNQRYLIAGPGYGTNKMARELLVQWYPDAYFAPLSKEAEEEEFQHRYDTSRAQTTFGLTFRSFDEMLKDLAEFAFSFRK